MKFTYYLKVLAVGCLSFHSLSAQPGLKIDPAAVRFNEGGSQIALLELIGRDLFIQNDDLDGALQLVAENDVFLRANGIIQSQAPYVSLIGDRIGLFSTTEDMTLTTNTNLLFVRGSTVRLFMSAFGTGMGTASPERLLHLESNIQNNFNPQLRLSRGSGYFDLDGATNFRIFNANGLRFIIDGEGTNEGNIGIGTSAPQRKLHLQTTASPQLRLQDVGGFMELYGGADFLVRNNAGTNRLVVQGGGRIFASNLANIGDFRDMQYNDITGEIGYDNSSRQDKRNIRNLREDFKALLDMTPQTYTRPWAPDRWEIGFIAEDFHDKGLFPLVEYDHTGNPDGLRYDKMITYIVPLLKEQQKELDNKTEQIDRLESEVALLKQEMAAMREMILSGQTVPVDPPTGSKEGVASDVQPYLEQNIPNPFSENSSIRYHIPEAVQRAELRISDAAGNIVRQFTILSRGAGRTDLAVNSLPGGVYFYYLVLDGRVVATKKMLLTGN